MNHKQTEYYFSPIVLFFATIFVIIFTVGPSYLFFAFYKENLLVAIAFSLPLIVLLIGLPDYLRFMYCAIIKKPALVLNNESLINNADGNVYCWNDIKSISYEPHTGFRAPPGGYISVTLRDTQSKIRIPQNSIKCKTTKLLHDLQKFHQAYHKQKFDKSNGGT
ncbi:MAG: hypothetical protein JNL24_14080 [Bacteroidia bacterium]|nr:hypothetical protein [Bacteroidia bacterium]